MKQYLTPFYYMFEKYVPDFNNVRVTYPLAIYDKKEKFKTKQWIYATTPENYDNDFPIMSISFDEFNPVEYFQDNDENDMVIFYEGILNISYYTKKGTIFKCDDGLERKNELFTEYVLTKFIIPTLQNKRTELQNSFPFIEDYSISSGLSDSYDSNDWLKGKSFKLKVWMRDLNNIPSDVLAIIQEITINLSLEV